jgi:VWFA-related protein
MKHLRLLAIFGLLSAQTPSIRVSTRLVEINVVAHEKGQPVSDLTKDDFTVTDRGKPQTIRFFAVTSRANSAQATNTLPPNTFSNQLEHRPDRPASVTILLIDGLNTSFPDQAYARQEIIKYLKQLDPRDRVAIYTLGRSLRIIQDFTNDPAQLARKLPKSGELLTADLANSDANSTIYAGVDSLIDDANVAADYYTTNRARNTLEAFEAIANHVASVPGRKNLVWVTASFPFSIGGTNAIIDRNNQGQQTFNDETTRAARLLNNANIAVYPVDARGLVGNSSVNARMNSSTNKRAVLLPDRNDRTPLTHRPEGIDTMNEIAARTGGKAFYDTNDLKNAIKTAVDDGQVTYTLGFYPDAGSMDNKFHELKVQLKRKGVNVRYRKGYIAFEDAPLNDAERERQLREAILSPVESLAIPAVLRLEHVDKPSPNMLRAGLLTDLRSFTLEQQSDHWTGTVAVIFVQQDKVGKILESTRDTLNLNLDRTQYEQLLKNGVPVGKYLKPQEGLATVRAIVMDQPSGKIGSLIIPVTQVK